MKLHTKLAVVLGALALATAPALALADPGSTHGEGKGFQVAGEKPASPGPKASLPEKAKAYGVYCREESRKHVAGEHGTPFSQCVTAMAKAAHNENLTPREACKELSHKHVAGEHGTPFSQCVVAAAKLQHEES
jgi:hypothetical protein